MKNFLSVLILFYTGSCAAAVYKSVDEEGNIVFTDRKQADSTEQVLSEPSVIPAPPKPVTIPSKVTPPKEAATKSGFVKYHELKIKFPAHDQALRSNSGEVMVELDLSPQFGAVKSHRIFVHLDGKKLGNSWQSTKFSIPNVDRGSHKLKVTIVDSETSRILISSEEIMFHLQRHSVAN